MAVAQRIKVIFLGTLNHYDNHVDLVDPVKRFLFHDYDHVRYVDFCVSVEIRRWLTLRADVDFSQKIKLELFKGDINGWADPKVHLLIPSN
jgi:hypothetical protein